MNTVIRRVRGALGRQPRTRIEHAPVGLPALADQMIQSLEQERLTFILGAGVSTPSGFPTWPKLLESLSAKLIAAEDRAAFEMLASFDSPLVVARWLKSQMMNEAAFPSAVRDALYAPTVDVSKANPTLDAVVAVIRRAHAAGARLDVITYNFDDLLEQRLATALPAVRFSSVATDEQYHAPAHPLRILHVHGFLDSVADRQPIVPPPALVLSEDDFHRLISNAGAWQNQVQVNAFGYRDCLFLGMSMTDPNLRRVIDFASRQPQDASFARWIVGRRYGERSKLTATAPAMSAAVAARLNMIKSEMFASLGAQAVIVERYDELSQLGDLLKAGS